MWHIAVQQKERKQLFLLNYFTPGIPKEPIFWSFFIRQKKPLFDLLKSVIK
jgi:hypothetical protein